MTTDLKCPLCQKPVDGGGCTHLMAEIVERLNALPSMYLTAKRRQLELRTLLSVVAEGYCIATCEASGPNDPHDGVCEDIQATQE